MLGEKENQRLTEVGAGTAMGELLRRYWHPIAAATEFDERPTKAVRLMGEDLVLYRDLSGTYGLIERHCQHRRADLSYGFVEKCGLRCSYHGWLYDETGQCTEQPYEDIANPRADFKKKIRATAYRVAEKGGLIWAYLGPAPAPLIPTWEPFTWQNGFRQIVFSEVPCNWVQCQENSIDPVHFEWMHANFRVRAAGRTGPYVPTHTKLDFDEFDHGFVYRRIREDTDENHLLWKIGRVCLWPNALFTGDHFEWRVPIDDTSTLSVTWHFARVPKEREPYVQGSIPYWYGPVWDKDSQRLITTHVMNQDFAAWIGQGRVTARHREHLGKSDRGVALLRKRFRQDLEAIEQGKDPKGLVRDPAVNDCIELPVTGRKILVDGMTRDEMLAHGEKTGYRYLTRRYPFQAGQPESINQAYQAAMGIDDDMDDVP